MDIKVYLEQPKSEQIKIVIPLYMEDLESPDLVGSFQFELKPPPGLVCTEIIPSPEFSNLSIVNNAEFSTRANLNGNARIAFAAIPAIKLTVSKLKICDFVFGLKEGIVFDLNEKWSGVWDYKKQLIADIVDTTLDVLSEEEISANALINKLQNEQKEKV